MRVEQRIGRVHRLGQTHDVNIYNLSTRHTIEEHILSLLHEKINMFEMAIGKLDTILERFDKKKSLETSLFRMAMEARSNEELHRQVDQLGDSLFEVQAELENEPDPTIGLSAILGSSLGHTVEVRP
jgi:hypothetical protein